MEFPVAGSTRQIFECFAPKGEEKTGRPQVTKWPYQITMLGNSGHIRLGNRRGRRPSRRFFAFSVYFLLFLSYFGALKRPVGGSTREKFRKISRGLRPRELKNPQNDPQKPVPKRSDVGVFFVFFTLKEMTGSPYGDLPEEVEAYRRTTGAYW